MNNWQPYTIVGRTGAERTKNGQPRHHCETELMKSWAGFRKLWAEPRHSGVNNERDNTVYVDVQHTKARWRCNLCSMRRDLVAASGVWFHGGLAQPVISSSTFRQTLTISGATPRTRPNSDCGGENTVSYLDVVSISCIFTVRRYALRGLSHRNSVRPSVCLSVTLVDCVHMVRHHDFFTIW